MNDTLTDTPTQESIELEVVPYEETDDPNTKTHVINSPMNLHIWQPGMTTKYVVDIARAGRLEIVALCGHKFVPKLNSDKYPACEPCIAEASRILREMANE